jgi:ATP-binding cassette subfamily B protein
MRNIEYPAVGAFDVFRNLWRGIHPDRFLFFGVCAAFAAGNIMDVLVPIFYKKFFDTLTTAAVPKEAVQILLGIIVTILLFNATKWLFFRIGLIGVNRVESRGMARLRQQSFDYLMRHSYSFFTSNFVGSLVQRVNRFARALEHLLDALFFTLIPLAVVTAGAVIVVWNTERVLAYVILLWIGLFTIFNVAFSIWKLKYDIASAAADSRMTGVLADIIANQNPVELFAAHADESKRFQGVTNDQAQALKRVWDLNLIVDSVQAGLIVLVEFAVFWYAIRFWGEGTLTAGTFVLVQVYVIQLAGRLWDFGRIVRVIYEAFADSKEMAQILALPHDIKEISGAQPISITDGTISFNRVTFNFHETRRVLDEVSLIIPGGQKVALVGPSGAGKTTIVRLLLRLYDVTSGKILIDGTDIRSVTKDSLHLDIALVPQEPVLFHRSLMDNIRYGKLTATDEEVMRAAHLAHCDEFIDMLPERYKTYVGERGVKLSGGERQRVAIARAILKNPPILILDEATSSLDSHSEALIQDALDTLMRGKTAIVIAHRLSTIRKMDRIMVIDGGAVVEDGTHDELLAKEGSLYRKLWELQAGGFITDKAEDEEAEEVLDV